MIGMLVCGGAVFANFIKRLLYCVAEVVCRVSKTKFKAAGDPEGFGPKRQQLQLRDDYLNPMLASMLAGDETAFLRALRSIPQAERDAVFKLAWMHNVVAPIAKAWKALPGQVREEGHDAATVLAEYERHLAIAGLIHKQHSALMVDISNALHRKGVRSASLKGHLLGERLWGGAENRISSDIDVLVGFGDMEAATAAMSELGFRPLKERLSVFSKWRYPDAKFLPPPDKPGIPLVEIHWLAAYGFGSRLSTSDLLDRSVPYDWPGAKSLRVLDAYDEFLMLAIHGAKHQFERAFWLYDLGLYLQAVEFDPDRLFRLARRYSAVNVLRYVFRQLHDQLQVDVSRFDPVFGGSNVGALALRLEKMILMRPMWAVRTKLLRMGFNLVLASGAGGKVNYFSERLKAALSRLVG